METERLLRLVTVYRGVMLYGESGSGKSSLVNAGVLPLAVDQGLSPERVRVQPREEEELVVERIIDDEAVGSYLPSIFADGHGEESPRLVLSIEAFESRVRSGGGSAKSVLVFDQFEEVLTLFDDANAATLRTSLVDMLVRLLREPVAIKLLFSFREDYLGRINELFASCPELVDQSLRLAPPGAESLPTIIRGPFDQFPDDFARPLSPALVERIQAALADRFGANEISLSEVQTVCLRLWQADDPETLLAEKGVRGLLEDYLGEALEDLPPNTRAAAIGLLSEMVTAGGTRNVVSADDLVQRVHEKEKIPTRRLRGALAELEGEARLIRRERRRDLDCMS